jgi:hypothetical protein
MFKISNDAINQIDRPDLPALCSTIILFFTATPNVISNGIALKGIHKDLGNTVYLVPFIGIANCLGSSPSYSRLSEN